MNPGPTLGWFAVIAAYTVVFVALFVFVGMMSARRRKLEKRRRELEELKKR
jgi:CcmD family protein